MKRSATDEHRCITVPSPPRRVDWRCLSTYRKGSLTQNVPSTESPLCSVLSLFAARRDHQGATATTRLPGREPRRDRQGVTARSRSPLSTVTQTANRQGSTLQSIACLSDRHVRLTLSPSGLQGSASSTPVPASPRSPSTSTKARASKLPIHTSMCRRCRFGKHPAAPRPPPRHQGATTRPPACQKPLFPTELGSILSGRIPVLSGDLVPTFGPRYGGATPSPSHPCSQRNARVQNVDRPTRARADQSSSSVQSGPPTCLSLDHQAPVVDSQSCRSSSTRDTPRDSSPVCRIHAEDEEAQENDQDPLDEDPQRPSRRSQSCWSSSIRGTPTPQTT